jgi:Peptidase propeptide and YPEB domain
MRRKERIIMKLTGITLVTITAYLLITVGSVFASGPPPQETEKKEASEQELARKAKVTKEAAQATALERAPGTVESAELEREHGKLVYSFDIRNGRGTIDEVQVSAITGKIVRVEHENKKQEAAEKRRDAKEKAGKQ